MHPLNKVIRVMEVNSSFIMGLDYLFRKKKSSGNILTSFSSHVISLC